MSDHMDSAAQRRMEQARDEMPDVDYLALLKGLVGILADDGVQVIIIVDVPTDEQDDDEHVSVCPACGDPIDYCQGHGEVGDPVGFDVLRQHDAGDHWACDPSAGCVSQETGWREATLDECERWFGQQRMPEGIEYRETEHGLEARP